MSYMEQMVPNISDIDIRRIIEREFPLVEFTEIEKILKVYKGESQKGKNRVYASLLKLSNGNIDLLWKNVAKANKDFRDILALSEYPKYSEQAFNDDLSDEVKKELIQKDWMQFQNWLNKY